MFRGFRWIALAAVVVAAPLFGPSVAHADCGGPAVSIYSEGTCSASGKHHPTGKSTHQATNTTPVNPSVPPPVVTPVQVPKKTQKALKHAGQAKGSLSRIVNNSDPEVSAPLKVIPAASTSALGSQFDLGSGPTFLVVLLLGTVLVLLGTGGVRAWRNRHRA